MAVLDRDLTIPQNAGFDDQGVSADVVFYGTSTISAFAIPVFYTVLNRNFSIPQNAGFEYIPYEFSASLMGSSTLQVTEVAPVFSAILSGSSSIYAVDGSPLSTTLSGTSTISATSVLSQSADLASGLTGSSSITASMIPSFRTQLAGTSTVTAVTIPSFRATLTGSATLTAEGLVPILQASLLASGTLQAYANPQPLPVSAQLLEGSSELIAGMDAYPQIEITGSSTIFADLKPLMEVALAGSSYIDGVMTIFDTTPFSASVSGSSTLTATLAEPRSSLNDLGRVTFKKTKTFSYKIRF